MYLNKYINNISGLQFYHLLRFTTFLIISVIFTKSHLSTKEIGDFEIMLFIASLVSFFWVTGLIQSFLSLYNNNKTFPDPKKDINKKSPEIFNAFLLISFFSFIFFILGHLLKHNVYVYSEIKEVPYVNILLIYVLISNPSNLIEYIYVLKNRSKQVVYYGLITHILQLVMVSVPILMGKDIKTAFMGLIYISVIRLFWLFILLKKYAEFKISLEFIKTHLYLSLPLIISTLLSGSAQYIDGLIVANKFDARDFAFFRYGAKELPLAVMLANGLHGAMIPEFSFAKNFKQSLAVIRKKSKRLINTLFPVSIVLLLFSNWIFIQLFNPSFRRSSDIFMIYLLLIISRLVFPQTILIGLKKTKVVLFASFVEIILNVSLSLFMIQYYGLQGVAVATAIIFVVEKLVLVGYNYFKLGINPNEYIPVKLHLIYSLIFIAIFVLIDHRIIVLY